MKKLDNLSFKSKHSFLAEFHYDLAKTDRLNTKKNTEKQETYMCMKTFQTYKMNCLNLF